MQIKKKLAEMQNGSNQYGEYKSWLLLGVDELFPSKHPFLLVVKFKQAKMNQGYVL